MVILMVVIAAGIVLLLLLRLSAEKKQPVTPPAPTAVPFAATAAPVSAPSETTESAATPAPTEEPDPTPVPEPEYFTVSFVGDCTLSASKDKLGWGIGFQMTVGDDYAFPFANTVELLKDDYMTIANLECVLSDKSYSSIEQFTFLSKTAYANVLSEGSVEFATLANNHTLDFGKDAYNDTAAALDSVGVAYAGEDETYIYQTGDGLKLGLYCLYNGLTGNAMSILSADNQKKLVEDSKKLIDAAVEKLSQEGAEYTIACLHMGTEGNYDISDAQAELCRYAIDAGFGSVYCTHAHRLQPAQAYAGGVIFYGMGNWSFGGHTNPGNGSDPAAFDTGIGQLVIKRVGSSAVLDSYSFIPCCIASGVSFPLNANSVNNYQPTPYKEGSDAYERAMSIINGTYEGANYAVGNYWELLSRMNG